MRMNSMCLAAATLLLPVLAATADSIQFKDNVYVKGPKVLLGDVADIDGENAEALASVELAPAATPGNTTRVDAALVSARLKNAGVNMEEVTMAGPRRMSATTLHLDITDGMVTQALRDYIEAEMPWDPANATVDVYSSGQAFVVPDGEVEFRWRPSSQYAYLGPGQFRGDVLVDGNVVRTLQAKATVQAMGDVAVAASDIERGQVIGRRNVTIDKRELSAVEKGAILNPSEIEGHIASTSIKAGEIITLRMAAPPVLVRRNQLVLVETTAGALTVRSRAKAMADGSAGDYISCANAGSREQFVGMVRRDGVVVVE